MTNHYRVAVIGSTGRGNYGHALDEAWLEIPETSIVAVADDDADGLKTASERLGVTKLYPDYRVMLQKEKPDIVAICTRWLDQHRDMILASTAVGAHVYMEKPFCRTLLEADEIVRSCEQAHVKLCIAHPTRFSPTLETLKELIGNGVIGDVLEYRGRGKEDRRGGGEDLWVLGTHVMDMILALGGQPQWCFATVTEGGVAVRENHVTEGKEGIGLLAGDTVRSMYGMPDGSTAYFASKRHMRRRPSRYGLQIFGSRGVIELLEGPLPSVKYLADPSWSPGRSNAHWQNISSAGIGVPEPLKAPISSRHYLGIKELIHAIENDCQPKGSVYDARNATEMILAIFDSHRMGKPVSLPLNNRQHPLSMLS